MLFATGGLEDRPHIWREFWTLAHVSALTATSVFARWQARGESVSGPGPWFPDHRSEPMFETMDLAETHPKYSRALTRGRITSHIDSRGYVPVSSDHRANKPPIKIVGALLLFVLLIGAVLAVMPQLHGSDAAPDGPVPSTSSAPTPKPAVSTPPAVPRFTSCLQVWAGGGGPLLKGDPGYSPALDPDGDGVACLNTPPKK